MCLPQKPWIDRVEFQMHGWTVELAGDIDLTIIFPWPRARGEGGAEMAMNGPTCGTMMTTERRGAGTIGGVLLHRVELRIPSIGTRYRDERERSKHMNS